MATHDYVIDNGTGSAVRADLNNVFQAILTNNSSGSAPSTTAAYMFWADTANNILKIRNSSNNAWVELFQLDGTLTLEDGAQSTPALAFRDDLNTGLFSAEADSISITTAGTERFRFGSAGQIGIGGATYGTSGHVLTSGGASAAPTWSASAGTTINNNAANRVITGSDTTGTLEGQSGLTYTGNDLKNIAADEVNFLLGSTNGGGVKITLDGDSNGDGTASDSATIEHDTTGNLHIRTDNPASGCVIAFSTNGTVRTIIDTDGTFRPFADNTNDLGSSSFRWRNLYTTDLQLSNEGEKNDVDGSWGSYTIQEGSEDLFLINKRNNKKYKFNLTEVS